MTDHHIPFRDPMIRALLDGRKTQTRRVIKAGKYLPEFGGGRYDDRGDPSCWGWEDCDWGEWITLDQWHGFNFVPYRVGDHLWVREAWRTLGCLDHLAPRDMTPNRNAIHYEADGPAPEWAPQSLGGRFRQGMHMPRWASRMTLIVTDVRVQRVQEISEADAWAEGVHRQPFNSGREQFRDLWSRLNANRGYGWYANPWVAAYTFTVHRQNIDQMDATQ